MNTSTPDIRSVAVEDIIPTPDNPRKRIDPEKASFKELVQSIKANGILQLPVGRPHPTLEGKVDLRAGHRRYEAAKVAGLTSIDMVIRNLDDRTAMEVTVLENLQREDLTPMEEARGVRQLQLSGHDLDEIASRLGKTRQWVVRRGSLMDLITEIQELGEEHAWSAEALELMARYSALEQAQMLKEWKQERWRFDHFAQGSVSYLRRYLSERQRELGAAPWKMDDAILLPKAGACNVCPQRTSCSPDLFDAEEPDGDGGKVMKGDRCLNVTCWKEKRLLWVNREIETAKTKHKRLILVRKEYQSEKDFPQAVGEYNVEKTKKSEEGAVPAMEVDGAHPGRIIWVKSPNRSNSTTVAVKAANAAAKEAAEAGDPEAAKQLLEAKRAGLENRRWAWVIDQVIKGVSASVEPTPASYKSHKGLVLLCAAFGMEAATATTEELMTKPKAPVVREEKGDDLPEEDEDEDEDQDVDADDCDDDAGLDWKPLGFVYDPWEKLELLNATTANPSLWVWRALTRKITESLRVHTVSEINEKKIKAAGFAAALVGLDAQELKQQADVEIPEPKAWQKLEATAEVVEVIDERLSEAQGKPAKKTVRAVKEKKGKK